MFDVSLPWANFWYDAFNVMLFLGAFAVAVGTYGSIKMGAIKERYSDERTTVLETQTEQAKAELGVAQADIAKANAQIAAANERAAALEKEAAQARLEQELLKARLAWRTMSPDMATKLEKALATRTGRINVQWTASDTESQYLAIQIVNVFEKAHWQIQILSISLSGAVAFGVRIPDSSSPDTEIVRSAFRSAGIPFTVEMPPLQNRTMAFGGAFEDAPVVFIGTKPQ